MLSPMKGKAMKKPEVPQVRAEDVKVRKINMGSLNAAVTEKVQQATQTTKSFLVQPWTGVMLVEGREPMLLTDEAVGLVAEALVKDGKPVAGFRNVDLYEKCEGNSFALMPSFHGHLPVEMVMEHLGDEVTLVEFMGERRGYNPRIIANEAGLMRYIKTGKRW